MRQTFDDYNETCEMIDGSTAIHPHHLGLLMSRGTSSTGPFGHSKQCIISVFDTNYLLSIDEVMISIPHHAQNMEEDLPSSNLHVRADSAPLSLRLSLQAVISTVVVATATVAAATVVAFPANAMRVAAWTTFCRLAHLWTTHS
jgi:hypothetical protein